MDRTDRTGIVGPAPQSEPPPTAPPGDDLKRSILKFQRQMVKSRPLLAAFTATLFLVPITLIAMSGFFE